MAHSSGSSPAGGVRSSMPIRRSVRPVTPLAWKARRGARAERRIWLSGSPGRVESRLRGATRPLAEPRRELLKYSAVWKYAAGGGKLAANDPDS